MPALLILLANVATAIVTSLANYFGRKALTVAASVGLFIALTGALFVTISALFNAVLGWSAVPGWLAQAVGMFIPTDLPIVLSSVVGARAARFAYDVAVDKVKLIAAAN